jgi:hypothetical protein
MIRKAVPVEALVVGLPGAFGAVLVVVALVLRAGGLPLLAPTERMTLPEAAALESDADVVRLLRAGADVNQAAWVRRTRIRSVNAVMTPMEAAMTSRHVSVMTLLAEAGARIAAADVPVLWCLAGSQQNADAQAWLRARIGGPFPTDCTSVRIPEFGR